MEEKVIFLELSEEYSIYVVVLKDIEILSYVAIESESLYFSIDLLNIILKLKTKEKINMYQLVQNNTEEILKIIKTFIKTLEEKYEEAANNDSLHILNKYLNTRDLFNQYNKLLLDERFSDKSLYEYGCKCFSRIEDGTVYEDLVETLYDLKNSNKDIQTSIKTFLSDYSKDNYIEVFRGFNDRSRENGCSYTFDYKVAKWFSKRWSSNGYVKKYRININDVIAYLDNGEKEILAYNAIEIDFKS